MGIPSPIQNLQKCIDADVGKEHGVPLFNKMSVVKDNASIEQTRNANCLQIRDVRSELASGVHGCLKHLDVMTVPLGASPLDKIAFYDSNKKMMAMTTITIPPHAATDTSLNATRPDAHFKVLLLDGEGFKAGGTTIEQHACRLFVHKRQCTSSFCSVLGCGGDKTFGLFKHACTKKTRLSYTKHHRESSRWSV